MRVDGKFVDAEGNKPEGQLVSNKSLCMKQKKKNQNLKEARGGRGGWMKSTIVKKSKTTNG
jgi:hypothetical protein